MLHWSWLIVCECTNSCLHAYTSFVFAISICSFLLLNTFTYLLLSKTWRVNCLLLRLLHWFLSCCYQIHSGQKSLLNLVCWQIGLIYFNSINFIALFSSYEQYWTYRKFPIWQIESFVKNYVDKILINFVQLQREKAALNSVFKINSSLLCFQVTFFKINQDFKEQVP